MRLRTPVICGILAVFPVAHLIFVAACARREPQALFTKPELITHGRLAVLGLPPELEQIFMAAYTKTFPGQAITFVERQRLQDIIGEQDLLQGRLNERTRARIKELFGVEALIMCTYSDGDGSKKLRVRIVNSATGAIVGSVISYGRAGFDELCASAVGSLKRDLMGEAKGNMREERNI